jgi:hypothetical protein
MSVLSMVADPDFQKLSPNDQQAALSGLDPDFKSLNSGDFSAVVTGLQKQAMTRPDLVAPPGVPMPAANMQPMFSGRPTGVGTSYQATPDEQTAAGHLAAVQNREQNGYGDAPVLTGTPGAVANTILAQPAIGIAKGAGETVNTLTGGHAEDPAVLQSNDLGQSIGKGIEGIAEFVAGDGALKGASLATKLGISAKIAKLAEASPTAAKIIEAGLNVLRGTTVSAGQSALHPAEGQTSGDAAIQGAEYGLGGGIVGEGLGAVAGALFKKTPAYIQNEAAKAVLDNAKKIETEVQRTQGNLQGGIENIARDAAEQHGVDPEAFDRLGDAGYMWTFGDAARKIEDAAKPIFDGLRKASPIIDETGNTIGNKFDLLTTRIKAAKRVLYGQPSSAEAYLNAEKMLKEAQDGMNKLFETGAGEITPEKLQAARNAWRAAGTLDDLNSAIDRAYTQTETIRAASNEIPEINPKRFTSQLNNAIRKISPDDLANALGGRPQIKSLVGLSDEIQKSLQNRATARQIEKAIQVEIASGVHGTTSEGKAFGGVGSILSGGTLTGITHMLGASNPISAGLGLSLGAMHWLYTHPTVGTKILRAAAKSAPIGVQGLKQTITHVYHPDGTLESLPQQ